MDLRDLRTIGSRLEADERLDALVGPLRELASVLPGEATRLLRGEALGHPVHPMLTDLPIGFWTSAFVLDLLPIRRTRGVATVLVGLGLASAAPTAAAGLADWSGLSREKQRAGAVHAASNLAATGLYGLSLAARLRGRHLRGVAMGMAGAAAATAGGYLGGHLVFGTEPAAPPQPAHGATPDGVSASAVAALTDAGPAG
jgi:uncharacterized membrane protein